MTAALVALARFGPFFAVHLDQPDHATPSMAERISSTAGRFGTQDRRVAASILFQGMAARLCPPPSAPPALSTSSAGAAAACTTGP